MGKPANARFTELAVEEWASVMPVQSHAGKRGEFLFDHMESITVDFAP